MSNEQTPDNSITQNVTTEGLKLTLEEMRRLYTQRQAAADKLDDKAGTILGSASLILTLITTLQLTLLGPDQPWYYWLGLAVAFTLYLVMILLTLLAFSPRTFTTPIKASWDILREKLFVVTEEEALLNLISAYEDQINNNKKILTQKARFVAIAIVLLGLIVIMLLGLSLAATI